MSLHSIRDVCQIALPLHSRGDGELMVMESGKQVPFAVARVFTVRADAGAVRGQHAHKRCTQFLVCVQGEIAVECDDGAAKTQYLLDSGGKGLLIPASIWGEVTDAISEYQP